MDRLVAIDLLRGIAVLLVLTTHLPFSWSPTPATVGQPLAQPAFPQAVFDVTGFGRFGVHLFLVISGFCIHLRWARVGDRSSGVDFFAFWRRRLLRLYPPYFLALLASITGLAVLHGVLLHKGGFPQLFGYTSAETFFLDVTMLGLLLQNLTDASQRIGNGPFWTLALEEQLYLLYFLLLLGRRRLGWGPTLSGVVGLTLLWRALPLVFDGLPHNWNNLGPARWIEWTLGAIAVEAYFGRIQLPAWSRSWRVASAATGAAIALNFPGASAVLPVLTIISDATFGLAFFVIVNIAVASERARAISGRALRTLAFVGLFSYSLYLTQEPMVVLAKHAMLRFGLAAGPLEAIAIMVTRIALAVVVGYLFFRIAEAPFIRLSRRIGGRRATLVVAGPAHSP